MNSFLLHFVLGFIVKELATAGAQVVWPGVKSSFGSHVKAIIHDSAVAEEVIALGDGVIDVAAAACQDTADLQDILTQAAAQNWSACVADLKKILGKSLPATPAGAELGAILAA